jgi:anti-sigma factor RsiW
MECCGFKEWLTNKEILDEGVEVTAREHLEKCERCNKLYMLDSQIEAQIKEGLEQEDPPDGLLARIEMNIQAEKEGEFVKRFPWKRLLPAVAVAALLLIILNPFARRFSSVEEIGTLAVESHLKNLAMTFKAGEVVDVPRWFEDKLGFEVSMPDLERRGLLFLGGRECKLDRNDVAYLFYEKEGEKVSLFLIDPEDLSFNLEPARTYYMSARGCDVKVWRERNRVYAMVE